MGETIYYYYHHFHDGVDYYVPVPEMTELKKLDNYSNHLTPTGVNELIVNPGGEFIKLSTKEVIGFYVKDGLIKVA